VDLKQREVLFDDSIGIDEFVEKEESEVDRPNTPATKKNVKTSLRVSIANEISLIVDASKHERFIALRTMS
jgi:hypothetical protein